MDLAVLTLTSMDSRLRGNDGSYSDPPQGNASPREGLVPLPSGSWQRHVHEALGLSDLPCYFAMNRRWLLKGRGIFLLNVTCSLVIRSRKCRAHSETPNRMPSMPTGSPTPTTMVCTAGWLLAMALLAACGQKPMPVDSATIGQASPAPAATIESAPPAMRLPAAEPAEPVENPGKLSVINFSPNTTPAGTPFNVQKDGSSGISFQLSRPAPPVGFMGWFDDKPLTGVVVSGTLVTATIPNEYLTKAGNYRIELEVGGMRLPVGTFVVLPR